MLAKFCFLSQMYAVRSLRYEIQWGARALENPKKTKVLKVCALSVILESHH